MQNRMTLTTIVIGILGGVVMILALIAAAIDPQEIEEE